MLLVQDNAGWHRSHKLKVPTGITIEFLPAYSPELQPAESAPPAPRFPRRKDGASRLWKLVDEPLVNEYFESLDEIEDVLVRRCNTLREMKEEIKNLTFYHWLTSI
ncbi:MAG: hypothetical protein AAFO04_29085 [Cyanobacteria bacterium J06592_8]|nr:hypothetical protein [Cyanobacteriota bacterium]